MKATQATTFKNVLPEHIITDYPKFVEFLRVYYEYMSKTNSPSWLIENLSENLAIDTATDTFLLMLKHEIGYNIPASHVVDRRILMKHIKDIYVAKGTYQSMVTITFILVMVMQGSVLILVMLWLLIMLLQTKKRQMALLCSHLRFQLVAIPMY